jgi:hypothetical protein
VKSAKQYWRGGFSIGYGPGVLKPVSLATSTLAGPVDVRGGASSDLDEFFINLSLRFHYFKLIAMLVSTHDQRTSGSA